jgi:hypothetical protein
VLKFIYLIERTGLVCGETSVTILHSSYKDTFFSRNPPNIKFHKNSSSVGPVVPCEQTDMTRLMVAFGKFANIPRIYVGISKA